MGRKRAESPSNIKFQQPDRSGPKEKTLLELAEERGLFAQAQKKQEENDKKKKAKNEPKITKIPIKPESKDDEDGDNEPLSPGAERFLDTTLYTMSLTMLHFTLDVLVQNQYSADRIVWPKVWTRAIQALFGMSIREHL